MSGIFGALRHSRVPSQNPKRHSDVPKELAKVELCLNGILDDIDTMLDEWNLSPLHGRKTPQSAYL